MESVCPWDPQSPAVTLPYRNSGFPCFLFQPFPVCVLNYLFFQGWPLSPTGVFSCLVTTRASAYCVLALTSADLSTLCQRYCWGCCPVHVFPDQVWCSSCRGPCKSESHR